MRHCRVQEKGRADKHREASKSEWKGLRDRFHISLPEFVAGEVAEAIIGGVFVSFTERRVIENLLDEFVDGQAVVEDHHADVDEFGGVFRR